MADIEVNYSNFFETTLNGLLASGATSATLTQAPTSDGTNNISAPYYLVIDPDEQSKREVIYVSASSGVTLSTITRDLENRYSGTPPDHQSGTTVRMAVVGRMFEDVHDRIDADETTNASHRSDTSNPHSVTAVQTGAATTSTALSDFAVPTSDLDINSNKLTNVSDPTSAQDAATRNWVINQGYADIGLIIALG